MSKEDIVYLLMILNVNRYANVILERSLHANGGDIGVNESVITKDEITTLGKTAFLHTQQQGI